MMPLHQTNKTILALSLLFGLCTKIHSQAFETNFIPPTLDAPIIKINEERLSTIQINVSRTFATQSFSDSGDLTGLFAGFGNIDFGKFAKEELSTSLETSGANIYDNFSTNLQNFKANLASSTIPDSDKILACHGQFENYEFELKTKAFFGNGLFASLSMPFRLTNVDNLRFLSISGQENAATQIVNDRDTGFDTILEEFGFKPLSGGVSVRGISDVKVGGGWTAAKFLEQDQYVASISGQLEIGGVLPLSGIGDREEEFFFSIPSGFKGHFGAYATGTAEIDFTPSIAIGGNLTTINFFKKNHQMRVKHSNNVDFLYFAKQTEVKLDLGSFWSAGAYIRSGVKPYGIDILVGYTYQSQERSALELADTKQTTGLGFYDKTKLDLLDNTTATGLASTDDVARDKIMRQDRKVITGFTPINNELINKDPRLDRWYYHVIHLALVFQPQISKNPVDKPIVKLSYSYPFWGKKSFFNKTYDGAFGFSFEFNF